MQQTSLTISPAIYQLLGHSGQSEKVILQEYLDREGNFAIKHTYNYAYLRHIRMVVVLKQPQNIRI